MRYLKWGTLIVALAFPHTPVQSQGVGDFFPAGWTNNVLKHLEYLKRHPRVVVIIDDMFIQLNAANLETRAFYSHASIKNIYRQSPRGAFKEGWEHVLAFRPSAALNSAHVYHESLHLFDFVSGRMHHYPTIQDAEMSVILRQFKAHLSGEVPMSKEMIDYYRQYLRVNAQSIAQDPFFGLAKHKKDVEALQKLIPRNSPVLKFHLPKPNPFNVGASADTVLGTVGRKLGRTGKGIAKFVIPTTIGGVGLVSVGATVQMGLESGELDDLSRTMPGLSNQALKMVKPSDVRIEDPNPARYLNYLNPLGIFGWDWTLTPAGKIAAQELAIRAKLHELEDSIPRHRYPSHFYGPTLEDLNPSNELPTLRELQYRHRRPPLLPFVDSEKHLRQEFQYLLGVGPCKERK